MGFAFLLVVIFSEFENGYKLMVSGESLGETPVEEALIIYLEEYLSQEIQKILDYLNFNITAL